MTMTSDDDQTIDVTDGNCFGGWTIEREADGIYALYQPYGLRAAPVYWDSSGRCWAYWEGPEDGEGVGLHGAVYAADVEALQRVMASARKPAGVQPRDPE